MLRAARTLFAERGYQATTVRAIAAAAGVTPAMIHHFFGSKQRVFLADLVADRDLDLPHRAGNLAPHLDVGHPLPLHRTRCIKPARGPIDKPGVYLGMVTPTEPIIVTISHRLGRDEAKRRIDSGLGTIRQELAQFVKSLDYSWENYRLDFRATAMFQTITGRIEVYEDFVKVELGLATGKRKADKRQAERDRDWQRSRARLMRSREL